MERLEQDLRELVSKGIQADTGRIKTDMCAQFENPDAWIREYVVNAADAGAEMCHISAYDNGKTLTVLVEDDGHGMDKKGVMDFCSIFKSVKHGNLGRAVGTHGVGKLSPAAVKGQCVFVMTTSTGTESWRMEAGCLLDNRPIRLQRVEPAPLRGTRFEITFEKRDQSTPGAKLKEYADLLTRHLKHFSLKIVLFETDGVGPAGPTWAKPVARIQGDWETPAERMGRGYSFELGRKSFDVVLGLGAGEHEVYQKKVLVTTKYNLLSHDLSLELVVPHLKIRVDSPDFELPFGRNCLRNEELLKPLSRHLRRKILPEYFEELLIVYENGIQKEQGVPSLELEEMACALLLHDDTAEKGDWRHLPLFPAMNSPRLSHWQLKQSVRNSGAFYLEIQPVPGTDYEAFNGPVICGVQPEGGIKVLEKYFSREMLLLGRDDAVVEMAPSHGAGIGEKEKVLEQYLGFKKAALGQMKPSKGLDRKDMKRLLHADFGNMERLKSAVQENIRAESDLASLKWGVNYLVHRDGKTPCMTHRFILKTDTVVLNLNHPEVKKLVRLSERDPALAGHWATAMCLSDESRILNHITPEKKDDLLMLDAISKVQGSEMPETEGREQPVIERKYRDFMRHLEEQDRR